MGGDPDMCGIFWRTLMDGELGFADDEGTGLGVYYTRPPVHFLDGGFPGESCGEDDVEIQIVGESQVIHGKGRFTRLVFEGEK